VVSLGLPIVAGATLGVYAKEGYQSLSLLTKVPILDLSLLVNAGKTVAKEAFEDMAMDEETKKQTVDVAASLWMLGYVAAVMERRFKGRKVIYKEVKE